MGTAASVLRTEIRNDLTRAGSSEISCRAALSESLKVRLSWGDALKRNLGIQAHRVPLHPDLACTGSVEALSVVNPEVASVGQAAPSQVPASYQCTLTMYRGRVTFPPPAMDPTFGYVDGSCLPAAA